jgi:hypothetical protein
MRKGERLFILLCVYFVLITIYQLFGKSRPYCDAFMTSDYKQQVALWNCYYYIVIDGLLLLLWLFNYDHSFFGKRASVSGALYSFAWLVYDSLLINKDLKTQVAWTQSELLVTVYSIITFGIAIVLGFMIANKIDNE